MNKCLEIKKRISIVKTALSKIEYFGHNSQIYKYKALIIKEFNDIEKFKKERHFLKKLAGKNIAPEFFDSVECGKKNYILMKFIDGLTLGNYCNKGLPFTISNAKKLKKTIKELHNQQILHNDLHMENILVIDKGHGNLSFRIIDFEQSTRLLDSEQEENDFYDLYTNIVLCEYDNQEYISHLSNLLRIEFEIEEEEME